MIRIPNKKDISRLRNTNSDLINLKENYSYFRTTISSNALQSFNNTIEIKNQNYKIKTIDSIHNNIINDNKIIREKHNLNHFGLIKKIIILKVI